LSREGPTVLQNPQNAVRNTFLEVWGGLPSLTKALTEPKARFGQPTSNHYIEHIEIFDLELYRSKTDEKRGSYGQILLSVVDKTARLRSDVCT
jgi:hypothetical protein